MKRDFDDSTSTSMTMTKAVAMAVAVAAARRLYSSSYSSSYGYCTLLMGHIWYSTPRVSRSLYYDDGDVEMYKMHEYVENIRLSRRPTRFPVSSRGIQVLYS